MAVTSPRSFAAIPAVAHCRDGTPRFDPGDFYLGGVPNRVAKPLLSCAECGLSSSLSFARYLHRILADMTRVGPIGSRPATGQSPLPYEVRVDGQPHDPEKFL